MIRYSLRCDEKHVFDAWFQGMDAFDQQAASGQVSCPQCGSTQVEKSLMAPGVAAKSSSEPSVGPREFFNQVRKYRSKVMAETEDVGRTFPTQARQMHEGVLDHRPIRGIATPDEAKAMHDDGVPVLPVPPEPPAEN